RQCRAAASAVVPHRVRPGAYRSTSGAGRKLGRLAVTAAGGPGRRLVCGARPGSGRTACPVRARAGGRRAGRMHGGELGDRPVADLSHPHRVVGAPRRCHPRGHRPAAGLGVLLSVGLVVEHGYRGQPIETWWVTLIQATSVAAAIVALGWLGVGRRLYGETRPSPLTAPLLAGQAALPLAGSAALLPG